MTKLSEHIEHMAEAETAAVGDQTGTSSIVVRAPRSRTLATSGLRRAILAFSLAFVVVAATVALFGVIRFGSASAGLLYLSGQRVVIEPRYTVIKLQARGGQRESPSDCELMFKLRNWTDTTFTVLGASSTCSCAGIRNLPLRVEAGSVTPIYGVVDMRKADAGKAVRLGFITDSPAVPLLNVTLTFSEGEP